MSSVIRLAFRNALRNKKRTGLTAATVLIGTAFTVVILSFLNGVMGGMTRDWVDAFGPVRIVTTEYAEREILAPLHANLPETIPLIETISSIEGVAHTAPMIKTGVIVSMGEELGEDPAILTGSSEEWYQKYLLPKSSFIDGVWLQADAKKEQVVIGGSIARNLSAKVGDSILLMGKTQYGSMAPISADVVGIITGNSVIDSRAYVTLETARWMVDIPDGALELLVYPASNTRSDARSVSIAVQQKIGDQYASTAWMDTDLWKQQLPLMDSIQYILSMLVVFVMSLAIFNTMTMSVLERTGEIGVMRAMGQTRMTAVISFLIEAVIIGVVGGIFGAVIGTIPALYLEQNGIVLGQDIIDDVGDQFAMTAQMNGELTPEILAIAVFCGILTAIIGAILPAMRAARIQPYEAMRTER